VLVVSTVLLTLVACGGNEFTGKWKLVKVEVLGIELNMNNDNVVLEINPDGTASLDMYGVVTEATWENSDEGITLIPKSMAGYEYSSGYVEYQCVITGNRLALTLGQDDDYVFHLKKMKL